MKQTKTVSMATSRKRSDVPYVGSKSTKKNIGHNERLNAVNNYVGDNRGLSEGNGQKRSPREEGNTKIVKKREGKKNVRAKKRGSSAEAERMRSRLIHLTGSDTIKVNDKDYMEKLRAKIWQEHEAELRRKELEREDTERQRMRRLLARGVIEPEQLREDKVLWREYRSRSNLYEKRYRGTRRKNSPRKDTGDTSARAKSAPQSRQQVKRVGLSLPSTELSSARARSDSGAISQHHVNYGRPVSSFANYSDTFGLSADSRQVSFSRHITTPTPSVSSSGSRSVRTPDSDDKRLSHRTTTSNNDNNNSKQKYEPFIIQEMRREETVAGLYKLAEIALVTNPDGCR